MTQVAQKLRHAMTDAERLLWFRLRRKQLSGYCFYRQRIIGEYIVDFYCREASLVIEIDGGQHFHGEKKKKDIDRDAFLKGRGLKVLRFNNQQVLKNTESVLEAILHTITKD